MSKPAGKFWESASFQECARYGLKGRVLWAVKELGRDPELSRVFVKAQIPGIAVDRKDKPNEFERTVIVLVTMNILELVPGNRIRFALQSPNSIVRAKCSYCPNRGPEKQGLELASAAAQAAGWVFMETDGRNVALCPSCASGDRRALPEPKAHPARERRSMRAPRILPRKGD